MAYTARTILGYKLIYSNGHVTIEELHTYTPSMHSMHLSKSLVGRNNKIVHIEISTFGGFLY